jgi:putative DNA primase/helicase
MRSYLQRVAGMALIGEVRDHKLIVVWGPPRTGKSTFLLVLRGLLGRELAVTLPAWMISTRRQTSSSELEYRKADLRGARLATFFESEDGGLLDEALVKTLTSGDPITARPIRERQFTFDPTHSSLLATNFAPEVITNDDAIWLRLVLVPFVHVIANADQVQRYDDRLLTAEGPGILAWAARGAAAYLRDGLGCCRSVEEATTHYRQDQDVVGRFVEDRLLLPFDGCDFATFRADQRRDLAPEWESWCRAEGRAPWKLSKLKEHLRRRGVLTDERPSNGIRWLYGFSIRSEQF